MNPELLDANRRRFQRVLFDTPVYIQTNHQRFESQLIDLSLRGALVRTPPGWNSQPLDPLQLVIILDTHQGVTIEMGGHTSHQDDGVIGIQCDTIDVDSITHLRRLVELNLGDPALLDRELRALV